MKKSGFKMKGYDYPGTSPVKRGLKHFTRAHVHDRTSGSPVKKDELVTVGTRGGPKYYASSTTSDYDVKWSQGTVNLMNANAPKHIIEKSKKKDIKNFKKEKGTYEEESPIKGGWWAKQTKGHGGPS